MSVVEPKGLGSHKPGMVVAVHYAKTQESRVERSGNSKGGVKGNCG